MDYNRVESIGPSSEKSYKYENLNPLVFINPVIKSKEGEMTYEEGCLSLPGLYEEVNRFEKISVEFQDVEGQSQTMNATELLSVCIQHENDHLDGVVFLERLSFIKRNFLTKSTSKGKKGRKTLLILELNLLTIRPFNMEKLKIAFFGTPDFLQCQQ